MVDAETFTPGENCEMSFNGQKGLPCQWAGTCQRASAIGNESAVKQRDNGHRIPGSGMSGLDEQIRDATCDHPTVKAAIEAA